MKKVCMDDTICAVATSAGGGGSISIIRISGKDSFPISESIFNAKIDRFESHRIYYGHIVNDGETIDEALLLPMKAPRSYTREDVIEIHCHGGVRSARKILETVIAKGARLAEQGEFTKRAFLNGRIDLSQAEAVIDIINAKTDISHKTALNQLSGNLSEYIKKLRNNILSIIANIEANIDYPENDIEELSLKKIKESTESLITDIKHLIKTADTGKIIREGIETVILGRPNVGKSSVMNALLKEERAIVTNIPGTTRDVLQEYININNIPLKIIDTAGIRDTSDEIEKIGVELSRKYAEKADLILIVIDSAQEITEEDINLLEYYSDKKAIVLVNKIDLDIKTDYEKIYSFIDKSNVIEISARNNTGFDLLYEKLTEMFFAGDIDYSSDITVSNMRHKASLIGALQSLENVMATINNGLSQDFMSIDLTDAYNYLGEITGDSLDEDIIDKIFSEFCLGK